MTYTSVSHMRRHPDSGVAHASGSWVARVLSLAADSIPADSIPLDGEATVPVWRKGLTDAEHCVVVVDMPRKEPAKLALQQLIAELTSGTRGAVIAVNGSRVSPLPMAVHSTASPTTQHDEDRTEPEFGRSAPPLGAPHQARTAAPPALTHRELEVLSRMSLGEPAKRIAQFLGISLHTCRGYIKSLYNKLGVRSQVEAVIKAQRLGLLDDP
jgi:DNA-binding CsgD family transcriptional regulator